MRIEYRLLESEDAPRAGLCARAQMNWRKLISSLVLLILITAAVLFWALCDGNYMGASMNGPAYTQRYWNYSFEDAKKFAWKNILRKFRPNAFGSRNLSFDRIRASPKENGFHITDSDVLVFLHIQKTAGTTFEKFLVRFLDLEKKCNCSYGRKRCKCYRPGSDSDQWLFSRYSTGWSCGLHADYTELVVSNCVDNILDKKVGYSQKRRYFYTTFLRDPISRFISEFRHVQRGATWKNAFHFCGGRTPTPEELPLCFDPSTGWEGVSLDEFLDCPYNLAFNRQTRMLADLNLVGCYNSSFLPTEKRDAILLESAKNNLENMAYFGIQEDMEGSQQLFEATFDLHFLKSMDETRPTDKSSDTPVSSEQMERIRHFNSLDLQLYAFAKNLFAERVKWANTDSPEKRMKISNSPFSSHLGTYFKKDGEERKQPELKMTGKKRKHKGPFFSGETIDDYYNNLQDKEINSAPLHEKGKSDRPINNNIASAAEISEDRPNNGF